MLPLCLEGGRRKPFWRVEKRDISASLSHGRGRGLGGRDDRDRKFLLLTLFLPLPIQLDQKPEGWWSLLSPYGDPPRTESRMEVGEE